MPEAERRPFTPEELKVLDGLSGIPGITRSLNWFTVVWDIGVGSCMLTGCLGLVLTLLVIGVIALLPTKVDTEQVRPVAFLVFLVVWIMTPLAVIATRYRKIREEQNTLDEKLGLTQEKMRADREAGVAAVERYRAKDAIQGILEEHRERLFFVRLEDDRILCLGFWSPPENDNPAGIEDLPKETGDFPSTEFEIARAPTSGILLSTRACGQPIRPSRTFVVKQGWSHSEPPLDQFLALPWEDIIKTYG